VQRQRTCGQVLQAQHVRYGSSAARQLTPGLEAGFVCELESRPRNQLHAQRVGDIIRDVLDGELVDMARLDDLVAELPPPEDAFDKVVIHVDAVGANCLGEVAAVAFRGLQHFAPQQALITTFGKDGQELDFTSTNS
jgi:hypothetical protein